MGFSYTEIIRPGVAWLRRLLHARWRDAALTALITGCFLLSVLHLLDLQKRATPGAAKVEEVLPEAPLSGRSRRIELTADRESLAWGAPRAHPPSRPAAPTRLVTVSRSGAACVRPVDPRTARVLPHGALPTQDDFLPGVKSPCWIQELSPDDVMEMRGNILNSHSAQTNRAAIYEPFATVPAGYARLRCLPYFYQIGAPKSATSDLWARLQQHPQFTPTSIKEIQWWTIKRFNRYERSNISVPADRASFDEYVNLWDLQSADLAGAGSCDVSQKQPWQPSSRMICGDASTTYMLDNYHHKRALEELDGSAFYPPLRETVPLSVAALQPQARLIAILREPGERMLSEYLYKNPETDKMKSADEFHQVALNGIKEWKHCRANRPREVCTQRMGFLMGSLYVYQLERWLAAFPREQLLVVRTEDLANNMANTMMKVFSHLDMSTPSDAVMKKILRNTRKNERRQAVGKVQMLPETRSMLTTFFQPFNARLAEMLGSNIFKWEDVQQAGRGS